ncbi:MAG: hypothetical protein Q9165_008015 [Trypethelium subeluteriae]
MNIDFIRDMNNQETLFRPSAATRLNIHKNYSVFSGDLEDAQMRARTEYVYGIDLPPHARNEDSSEISTENFVEETEQDAVKVTRRAAQGAASLARMVFKSTSFECKDQRDKVYAVLAFLQPFLSKTIKTAIPITYDKTCTAAHVYTEFAKIVLMMAPRISMLSYAGQTSHCRRKYLPSWAPDLAPNPRRPLWGRGKSLVDVFEAPVYNAMQCRMGSPSLRTFHGSHFICQGAVFDEVLELCDASNEQNLCFFHITKLFEFAAKLDSTIPAIDRVEALWRTWSGNYCFDYITDKQYYPMDQFSSIDFKHFVEELIVFSILLGKSSPESICEYQPLFDRVDPDNESEALPDIRKVKERIEEGIREKTFPESQKLNVDRYSNSMQHIATGRRLFLTRKGFLGMGSAAAMKKEDKIYFCQDSLVPLLLRRNPRLDPSTNAMELRRNLGLDPSTDVMELVSDCYLHGSMNGEILEDRWGLKNRIEPVLIA